MRAGRLRHKVTVQQVAHAQDDYGETTETWSEFIESWASIEPLRGREYHDASLTQGEVDTRIVMRYREGILPTMRVLFGSRVFDIQTVINVNTRHREIHLMCKEYFGDSKG